MHTDDEVYEEQMQADAELEVAAEKRRHRKWQREYDNRTGQKYGMTEKDFC